MNTNNSTGADWDLLIAELDAWERAGKMATLWWRDDDAVADTAALQRLVETARDIPLSVAVIPNDMQESLHRAIGHVATVDVLQHGFAHINHAPATEKKAEYGDHRPQSDVLAELTDGFQKLRRQFGTQFKAVFVPPWNRMSPGLTARLHEIGFTAASTYGEAHHSDGMPRNVQIVNTHVDIIDWRGSRGFLGVRQVLSILVDHLAARRTGKLSAHEPTGVLTHHLVHDDASWSFLARLVPVIHDHRAAAWSRPFQNMEAA